MGEMLCRSRKWMFWDALVLLALSGYELISRLDALWGPLKMFVNMAVGEGIPLERVATYVDLSIFETPLFMLLCMITALVALFARSTRRGCVFLLSVGLLLTVWGTFIQLSLLGEMIRFIKVLPLLILSVLSAASLILQSRQRRQLRSRAQRRNQYAGYALPGERFQQGIADHPQRPARRRRAS